MWKDNIIKDVLDGSLSWQSWRDFEAKLHATFPGVNKMVFSYSALTELQMDEDKPAQDFFTKFESLSAQTGLNDAGLIPPVLAGLPYSLVDAMSRRYSLAKVESYHKLKAGTNLAPLCVSLIRSRIEHKRPSDGKAYSESRSSSHETFVMSLILTPPDRTIRVPKNKPFAPAIIKETRHHVLALSEAIGLDSRICLSDSLPSLAPRSLVVLTLVSGILFGCCATKHVGTTTDRPAHCRYTHTQPDDGYAVRASRSVGGGSARSLPFTPEIDPFVVTAHRSNLYHGFNLKYNSYGKTLYEVDRARSAVNDPVYAILPLTTMTQFLTAKAIREVLSCHSVRLPSKANRAALDNAMARHVCDGCPELVTQLELAPGKQLLSNARNRVHRAKVKQEQLTDSLCMQVDEPSPLRFAQASPTAVPFPPHPLTPEDEIAITKRACAKFDPIAFEEAGCAVCGQLTLKTKLSRLKEVKGLLAILEVEGCAKREIKCRADAKAEWVGPVIDDTCSMICNECRASIRKGKIPKYALAKGLWIGNVPTELAELRDEKDESKCGCI
ncbi:hypothetical protein NMY22_g14083 [Coprinellus aureogranulatus]|nr:hypothetical protein NMY22_g14083 [Coprinellus aureogranulatus]